MALAWANVSKMVLDSSLASAASGLDIWKNRNFNPTPDDLTAQRRIQEQVKVAIG